MRLAVSCDDCLVIRICETVLEIKNCCIIESSSSVLQAIFGSNIRAKLSAEPKTSSFYDFNFDSITEEIVTRVQC